MMPLSYFHLLNSKIHNLLIHKRVLTYMYALHKFHIYIELLHTLTQTPANICFDYRHYDCVGEVAEV